VLTPKELALLGPKDVQELSKGNGGQSHARAERDDSSDAEGKA
jgi:hypothetical protein